jgi:trehalose/maltose hydrolase-like predicted phosphorylase
VPERGAKTQVAVAANALPDSVSVPRGGRASLQLVTAVSTSDSAADPAKSAAAALAAAVAAPEGSLLAAHTAAWAQRWANGGLEAEGDLPLAQALNGSLYFIRSSVRADTPQGLSPGGLASNGYSGHSFWDQETWMWPPLLMLDPGCAKSCLQYRLGRSGTAREKAQLCGTADHSWCNVDEPGGYHPPPEAMMFPWESAHSGAEVQYSAGKIARWGLYEQHISGDIALAARQVGVSCSAVGASLTARPHRAPGGSELVGSVREADGGLL